LLFPPGEPVCAGDTITVTSKLREVYAKTGRTGTMAFIVFEVTYRNQLGQMVAQAEESQVRRNVERGG